MSDAHGVTHPAGTYARVRQPVPGQEKKAAKSGNGGAFDAQNAAYATAHSAERSGSVLNAADITALVARSLLLARLEERLSQERLAEIMRGRGLKIRRNEIRRWEHGEVRMRESTWLMFVAYFDHTPDWWLADHSDELARYESDERAA